MPTRATRVRAHHRHVPESYRVTKVQAYTRHQDVRGPQSFLEEYAGPRQVKLEGTAPPVEPAEEQGPQLSMQCRKYPGTSCMGKACAQYETCKPSSWNPEDPRRKESEQILADARQRGEITEDQAFRLEQLADDLILDYLTEKRWNGMDLTDRTWWLGPISAVHDRSWAHESWANLPGEVKTELMRTYRVAEP